MFTFHVLPGDTNGDGLVDTATGVTDAANRLISGLVNTANFRSDLHPIQEPGCDVNY